MKIISEFISENCSTSQLIAVFFILEGNERQEFAVVHPYLIKSGSFWQKSKTFKLIICNCNCGIQGWSRNWAGHCPTCSLPLPRQDVLGWPLPPCLATLSLEWVCWPLGNGQQGGAKMSPFAKHIHAPLRTNMDIVQFALFANLLSHVLGHMAKARTGAT